jgi:hypothetical protein
VVDPVDRVVGSIAFRAVPATRSASVGYWVAPEARRQGRASAALRLLCDWLFRALAVERIELTTDPENLASQQVATRCGFRQEGYLRAHLRYRQTGARRDSILWALLPDELAEAPEAQPRIVWLNGTFGAGKSSAAAELKLTRCCEPGSTVTTNSRRTPPPSAVHGLRTTVAPVSGYGSPPM